MVQRLSAIVIADRYCGGGCAPTLGHADDSFIPIGSAAYFQAIVTTALNEIARRLIERLFRVERI
jgi:hypothetical protein